MTDVTMPQLGETVAEGTVTRWLRNIGDTVVAEEPLLEVSTDKVDTEVTGPGLRCAGRDRRGRGHDRAGGDSHRPHRCGRVGSLGEIADRCAYYRGAGARGAHSSKRTSRWCVRDPQAASSTHAPDPVPRR
jgi:hypothetical protein